MLTITLREFRKLANYIESNYGIHLKEEKKTLVIGRLHTVLAEKGFKTFTEYFDYLTADNSGNEAITLMNKITTNHTFFMREADHFEYFKDEVLPYLANNAKDKDLRIWSAGCSTGEEPYTLAMIIDEFFGKQKLLWDTKILATDISSKVLRVAIDAKYKNEQISTLPASWRINYFKRIENDKYVITQKIKDEVIFRRFNLMQKTFPFRRKLHVIFCRNVMIYFDGNTRSQLIDKFYEVTEPGGYLFIGHSESLNREKTKYKYVKPAVYRKV